MEKCFIDSLDNKGTAFDGKLFKDIASKTISISESDKQQIEKMEKADEYNRYKYATIGDITSK
mgnify:CR=1 FL=1